MSGELLNDDDDDHSRTIIHIAMDGFYAQVEMMKNPRLRDVPLAVQQKEVVVASNSVARQHKIRKCMLVREALELCPQLVLVKAEELHEYRTISAKVTAYLQKYSVLVEKLGLDENFVDVTELVRRRLADGGGSNAVGHVYGSGGEPCECGCAARLNVGSAIAAEMRQGLREQLGLISCAGIAHNKLLAKLAAAAGDAPDQQTVVYPSGGAQLVCEVPSVRGLRGVGERAAEQLQAVAVRTVRELRSCAPDRLRAALGADRARRLQQLSRGRDPSPVRPAGLELELRDKFQQLLRRLLALAAADGRVPRALRVTVRKRDAGQPAGLREQRQCNVPAALFSLGRAALLARLLALVMQLFHRLVDVRRPFSLTLLGLTFTKLQERQPGRRPAAALLLNNLSVQCVTSLQGGWDAWTPMDASDGAASPTAADPDGSESELEPSPKKGRFGALAAKKRCLDADVDCSPSKLRVAELRLSSRELDADTCPAHVDRTVFHRLPADVRSELLDQWAGGQQLKPPASLHNSALLKYIVQKP